VLDLIIVSRSDTSFGVEHPAFDAPLNDSGMARR
jgi:hypothetical protein